jgi:hypothetical protein
MLTRSSSSALELGLNPAKRVKLAIDDEPDKVLAHAPSGESMRLSEVKRNFLRFIAGGFRVLFACSYAADEIGEGVNDGDDEDAEMKYIRVNLLSVGKSMIGTERYWFSERKLDELFKSIHTAADEDLAINALDTIGEMDMCVGDAFDEACVSFDEFQEYIGQGNWTETHELLYAAFSNKEIRTHEEFMEF